MNKKHSVIKVKRKHILVNLNSFHEFHGYVYVCMHEHTGEIYMWDCIFKWKTVMLIWLMHTSVCMCFKYLIWILNIYSCWTLRSNHLYIYMSILILLLNEKYILMSMQSRCILVYVYIFKVTYFSISNWIPYKFLPSKSCVL